eukprot:TRINITY_DN3640_c0_g1_i2.p1 TRINITY_DN3640_c0_g1~~TRINITY_DN3640_c0_g1_i2.p1  ORF type:complete len:1008 (-),score=330.85 TRINITY_DN3640_c0_g1_i2:135-3158(-)
MTSNVTPTASAVISSENPEEIFDLIEEIAAGAFGAVYKGTYKPTGESVAVKIVGIQDEDAYNDLLMEIGIMKRCSHPNVVKFFGAYQQGEELWIAMELCQGSINTLYEVIEEPLGEAEIAWVLKETTKGLDYLHNVGIIHRDIKAPNILLTSSGEIKLADFGVSALLTKPDQKRNTFVGTPWWMAPEIIIAARDFSVYYDTKVDIWALGVMCLELAHCRPPLSDLPPMEVLVEIPNRPPPALEEPDRWSKTFQDFIQKCLVKKIDDRKAAKELLQHPFLSNPNVNREAFVKRMERAEKAIQEFQAQNDESSDTGTTKIKDTKNDSDSEGSKDSVRDSVTEGSGSSIRSSSSEADSGPVVAKHVKRTYRAKTLREKQSQGERILQEKMLQLQLRAMKRQQKENLRIQQQEQQKKDEALEKVVKKHLRNKDRLQQSLQEQDSSRMKKAQRTIEEMTEKSNKELRELQKNHKDEYSKNEKKLLKTQKEELTKAQKISKEKKKKVDELKLILQQQIDRVVSEATSTTELLNKTQQLKIQQQEQMHGEHLKQLKEKHGIVLDGFRQMQKLELENIQNESGTKQAYFQQYKNLVVSQLSAQLSNEYAQYKKDRAIYSKTKLREIQEKLLLFEKEDKKKEKLALAKLKTKADKKKMKDDGAEKRRQKKMEDELKEKQALELGEFQKENQWQQLQLETQRYQEEGLIQKRYELQREIVNYSLQQQFENFTDLQAVRRDHHKELIRLVQQQENQSLKLLSDGMMEMKKHQDNFVKVISKTIDGYVWDQGALTAEGVSIATLTKEYQDQKNKIILQSAQECDSAQKETDKVTKITKEKTAALIKALNEEYSATLQAMLLEKKEILKRVHSQREGEVQKLNEEEFKAQDLYHANQLKLFELKLAQAHQMLNKHHKQQLDLQQFFFTNLLVIKHDIVLQQSMKDKLAADHAKQRKEMNEEYEVERNFLCKRQDDQKRELKARVDKELAAVQAANAKEEQQLKDSEVSILLEVQLDAESQ